MEEVSVEVSMEEVSVEGECGGGECGGQTKAHGMYLHAERDCHL